MMNRGTAAKSRPTKTIKRLLKIMAKEHKAQLIIVFFMILISAFANVRGSLFLQVVIDDYITPLIGQSNPNFTGLLKAIMTMALIYVIGIAGTLSYNLIMVKVSEGTQKKIRDQMFTHLETLPLRYFDSNADGDIMSPDDGFSYFCFCVYRHVFIKCSLDLLCDCLSLFDVCDAAFYHQSQWPLFW